MQYGGWPGPGGVGQDEADRRRDFSQVGLLMTIVKTLKLLHHLLPSLVKHQFGQLLSLSPQESKELWEGRRKYR